MDKFTSLTGVAAPLEIDNVDTDMIIPKQYLKTIKRTGLGAGLFAEMRYLDDGSPDRGPEVQGDRYASQGHGLFLVEQLASRWGYLRDLAGTTVWFELDREIADGAA